MTNTHIDSLLSLSVDNILIILCVCIYVTASPLDLATGRSDSPCNVSALFHQQ